MPTIILVDGTKQKVTYSIAARVNAYLTGLYSLKDIQDPEERAKKEKYLLNIKDVDFSDIDKTRRLPFKKPLAEIGKPASIMYCHWVIGEVAPHSLAAKDVLSKIGHGYHLLNPDRSEKEYIIYAFKYPSDGTLPQHLRYADKQQIAWLERFIKEKGE